MSEVLKDGPIRRFLKEREPLVPRKKFVEVLKSSSHSILLDREVDAEIERAKAEKISEWRARGYPEHLIKMGEDLAREWTISLSKAFAPAETPEIQEAIIRTTYPKGLSVADRWLRAMVK